MIKFFFRFFLIKQVLFLVALVSAVVIPYASYNRNWMDTGWSQIQATLANWRGENESGGISSYIAPNKSAEHAGDNPFGVPRISEQPTPTGVVTAKPYEQILSPHGVTGPRVAHFHEIINPTVTPPWVLSRWPRVTTTLAELGMQGFRVPVTTGPELDDIAGALTYYFDEHDKLKRITLDGFTGDERRLVTFCEQQLKFTKQSKLGKLWVSQWHGRVTSAMRLSYAPVMERNAAHKRYEVMLEYNPPSMRYGLSQRFQQTIDSDRALSDRGLSDWK
ncbi:MAG: hypothetical protein ACI9HK_004033 [Pirellulaceae bacterium]|jgi:hypothetical protein